MACNKSDLMNVGDPEFSQKEKSILEQAEKCREPEEETQEVRRFIVPLKSGNADGGKGPGQSRPLSENHRD